jgi:hypothetical protein
MDVNIQLSFLMSKIPNTNLVLGIWDLINFILENEEY